MDKEKIIKEEIFPAVVFNVNSNGGMGGGFKHVYIKGHISDLKTNSFGHFEVVSLKGEKMTINPMWCSEIIETEIIERTCEALKWNGLYLKECEYLSTNLFFTKWVHGEGEKAVVIDKTEAM